MMLTSAESRRLALYAQRLGPQDQRALETYLANPTRPEAPGEMAGWTDEQLDALMEKL